MGAAAIERELQRQRRLRRLATVLAVTGGWLWWRALTGQPFLPLPSLPPDAVFWLPGLVIIALLAAVIVLPILGNARSPHVEYRPEQLDVSFSDVKGIGPVLTEVKHTLQVLLDYRKFRDEMGGRPRRGVLFEGPPGTGKTHVAKAMAKEANVPFLFVSSTAFQSMWYGMTARRIRSYFRTLRKAARNHGGAIGFIEEFDAIGMKRSSQSASIPARSGLERFGTADTGGFVNELLIQMQSFDDPTTRERITGWLSGLVNRYLPPDRQLRAKQTAYANILLIGATNRASSLDPALLRPGRFDRVLHFGLPSRSARRELVDYFLGGKAHDPALDTDRARDDIASMTLGASPAAIERLFDEALLLALRDGRDALTMPDVRRARTEIEIGLPEPSDYPEHERRTIAVHEAGHATVAYLVGKGRKLEMLSIIKRREALGFLAHRLQEERHTQRESEMRALIQIALGGMVAEELFFGESGTGPGADLAGATSIAVEMVGSLGLGGSLISFRALDEGLLGSNLAAKVLANSAARRAVDDILDNAKVDVRRILSANRQVVEALSEALLARNELVDEEILEIIEAAEPSAEDGTRVIDLRDGHRLVRST